MSATPLFIVIYKGQVIETVAPAFLFHKPVDAKGFISHGVGHAKSLLVLPWGKLVGTARWPEIQTGSWGAGLVRL
jgi:hypothetical protein